MGGPGYDAFQNDRGESLSFSQAIESVTTSVAQRQLTLCFDNAAQATNDGMFAEGLLCGSTIAASHANGLKGIMAVDFIQKLFWHCLDVNAEKYEIPLKLDRQPKDLIHAFLAKIKIPFLSPPNVAFPAFLLLFPDFYLGNVRRTRNKDMVDLKCSDANTGALNFSGEAKDHKDAIDLETMKEIIQKIPVGSKFHIVYVNKLQGSYFNSKQTYDAYRISKNLRAGVVFAQIYCDKNKRIHFEQIKGIPFTLQNIDCAVLFLVLKKF
jgi:hypothetical protein